MQSGASFANDRLVLVLLNIPATFQPMLDVHTSCWAGEDQYCHEAFLQVAADRALIWRKACGVAYGNMFMFSPSGSPSRMAGFISLINNPSSARRAFQFQ
jgi:hypothetical protein